VDGALGEVGQAAAEETQLAVGPVAAVAERAAQKMIKARNVVGGEGWIALEQQQDFKRQFGADFLIGVKRKNPVAGGVRDGGVFLLGKALPRLLKDPRASTAGNFKGTLASVRGRLAASFRVMMATDTVLSIEARINRRAAGMRGNHLAGNRLAAGCVF
jgi:hypothetical protein